MSLQLAIARARIAAVALLARIDDMITAAREPARFPAGIGVRIRVLCPPVAPFSQLNDAVAARGALACTCAGIRIAVIAVVTLFICIHHAVTAGGKPTGRLTGIRRCIGVQYSRVALLRSVNDSITASQQHAIRATGIRLHIGVSRTVVAFFPGLFDPIAATRQLADITAAIGVVLVSVITLFPLLHDAIAAAGECAVIRTGIQGILIPVVAFFAFLHDAIPACGRGWRRRNDRGRR